MADKKHSVFVSSTYKDLRQARQRVMFALLEMNCIPAGMELFPAANESQWKVIQRVIDECDYYILVLGGRYGSIAPNLDGMSYTEMEYRYALEQGIPILRFPHEDPKSLLVGEEERKGEDGKWAKLEEFRAFVQEGGTAKHWKTLDELYGKVSSTLAPLLAKSDRPGWVRGGTIENDKSQQEVKILEYLSRPRMMSATACVIQDEILREFGMALPDFRVMLRKLEVKGLVRKISEEFYRGQYSSSSDQRLELSELGEEFVKDQLSTSR